MTDCLYKKKNKEMLTKGSFHAENPNKAFLCENAV